MFTDYCDIMLRVEDRAAGRIASHALDSGCEPVFSNPRGPYVDVQFTPPAANSAATVDVSQNNVITNDNTQQQHRDSPLPALLYGWVERVSGEGPIHLLHTDDKDSDCDEDVKDDDDDDRDKHRDDTFARPRDFLKLASTGRGDGATHSKASVAPPPSSCAERNPPGGEKQQRRVTVCGQVSFILHLWSTPQRMMHPGLDGNASTRSDNKKRARKDGNGNTHRHHHDDDDDDEDSGALFNARGETVVPSDPFERELELRDDRPAVRSAVESVMVVGRALAERPAAAAGGGATVQCYLDGTDGSEYVKIG